MEVYSVYIEKIENKGRALWVLGVFARDWEETMPAHTRARRRWRRRRRRPNGASAGVVAGSGSGTGPGAGSLPGLVLFEAGLTGVGSAEHTRYPDPNRSASGCRTSWTANGCGGWVETLQWFRPNRCNY